MEALERSSIRLHRGSQRESIELHVGEVLEQDVCGALSMTFAVTGQPALGAAPGFHGAPQASRSAFVQARQTDCVPPCCWRGSKPQRATLRSGKSHAHEMVPGRTVKLALGRGLHARLAAPDRAESQSVVLRPVKELRGVPGLPGKGASGVSITPSASQDDVLVLTIHLPKKLASRAVVVAATPRGRDMHRVPMFGRRVSVPVVAPTSVIVVPHARASRWVRARASAHMPARPYFKIDHVLAGVLAPATSRTRSLSVLAAQSQQHTAVLQTFSRYREYVQWLQAKYARDPERAVNTVAPAWLTLLHHTAVAAEVGLVDPDEVTQETAEFTDYMEKSIDQWLDLLTEPCVRQVDVRTVLRLLRRAAIDGLTLNHDPSSLEACPYLLTGTISATRYQLLHDEQYLGPGSRSEEQSTTELSVRVKVFGQLAAPLPAASGTTIDQGTTVNFAGSYEHENSSSTGMCAELWDYLYVWGEWGPHVGPVQSIAVKTGDTGRMAITVSWSYVSQDHQARLVPTTNGCDWDHSDTETAEVESQTLIDLAGPSGTTFDFTGRPPWDPATQVTGSVTATEIVE